MKQFTGSQRIATVLGSIQVHVSGSGETAMVCWPSLLMTSQMWQAQAAQFGDRYCMVLVDPPGHGGSAPLRRSFTLDECALCLSQILDALQMPDCVLLGNSWGGMMGGVFAARYPQRLRAAVLMNCTASPVGWMQKLEFLALTAIIRRCAQVPGFVIGRAVKAFAGETTERSKPEVIARIRATVAAANPRSVHWAIRSVVPHRQDQRARMAQIQCPVLVLAGAEDRTFPVAETRAMAEAIPGSRFSVLAGVGHLAALEAPAEVNAEIERFLHAS